MSQILANPAAQANPGALIPPCGRCSRSAWDAPSMLRLWHLASLDAPTVAVVWSLAFAWTAHIRLPGWSPFLLALVAWTVYIGDRLLDAHAGLCTPPLHHLQERHHFHWRHRRVFAPLAVAAAAVAAWMVLALLPARALRPDSVVAIATLAYFSGVHSRLKLPSRVHAFFSREFLVGTLFTIGCVLPVWCRMPLSQGQFSPLDVVMVPMVLFVALAWLNCRAIGHWESEPVGPSTERGGATRIFFIAGLLAMIGSLAAVALFASGHPRSAAMLAAGSLSALLLAGLDQFRSRITPLLLRCAADLVLLTPVLLLPFALRYG